MSKHKFAVAVFAGVLLVGGIVVAAWPKIESLWPALGPVADTPMPSQGTGTDLPSAPLHAEDGWEASLLTDKVSGARDMAVDQFGNIWVSQTSKGTVSLVTLAGRSPGQAPEVNAVLHDLRNPHGLAFDPAHPTMLYVATETAVYRLPTYSDGGLQKIADLPVGAQHYTRSLLFGADGRLYVSIGSTCDVCREKNPEYASIISMKPDGTDRKTVAMGLRNSVFMTVHPDTHAIYATDMGRDHLGDDLPPDEVNIVLPGSNYGWPICYGDKQHDTDFDKNVYIRDPCADTKPPLIQIPAHSAPLGLAFMPSGDLLVAYHGSWDRTIPTGYKVVRWHWAPNRTWVPSDFLTGFLRGNEAIGRPVDVLPMADGSVLVSDDKSGSIWVVAPTK